LIDFIVLYPTSGKQDTCRFPRGNNILCYALLHNGALSLQLRALSAGFAHVGALHFIKQLFELAS